MVKYLTPKAYIISLKILIPYIMTIKDLNTAIYFSLSNNYIQIETANRHSFFYDFIQKEFSHFLNLLNNLNEDELKQIAKNYDIFYELPLTKRRFKNLMNFITDKLLEILRYCYKGDLWYAGSLLQALMGESNKKMQEYLIEPYIEYFKYRKLDKIEWYRMRDSNAWESVDNCWHLPYNLRHKASAGRFNMEGFPCLYLADSLETANAELGNIEFGKLRWYCKFKLKQNKKNLFLMDLSIPNLNEELTEKEELDLIITYPIRLLCSVKTSHKGNSFHEEYYLPQLMCQMLMTSKIGILYKGKGMIYSSTKNLNGINCILPAIYNGIIPPQKGYSNILLDLFETSKPIIYKTF